MMLTPVDSTATPDVVRTSDYEILGRIWRSKCRRLARVSGVHQVARNLRKQGVGLMTALLLLTRN